MFHRWLSGDANPGDNCLQCFACGVAVDFSDGNESEALMFLFNCPGPVTERSHHLVFEGSDRGLNCAYGDLLIGPETLPSDIALECVGA